MPPELAALDDKSHVRPARFRIDPTLLKFVCECAKDFIPLALRIIAHFAKSPGLGRLADLFDGIFVKLDKSRTPPLHSFAVALPLAASISQLTEFQASGPPPPRSSRRRTQLFLVTNFCGQCSLPGLLGVGSADYLAAELISEFA